MGLAIPQIYVSFLSALLQLSIRSIVNTSDVIGQDAGGISSRSLFVTRA